ncbi:hypothetical protein [Singulisphaera acidiphila]|nr:hypothetical protein [Singulisphaera acidiphila]
MVNSSIFPGSDPNVTEEQVAAEIRKALSQIESSESTAILASEID